MQPNNRFSWTIAVIAVVAVTTGMLFLPLRVMILVSASLLTALFGVVLIDFVAHAAKLKVVVRALLDDIKSRHPKEDPREWRCPYMKLLDEMVPPKEYWRWLGWWGHRMHLDKPYSVLYSNDNYIYGCGPFPSYEKAIDYIREHSSEDDNREFDLDDEYVYILTPDHRLLSVGRENLDIR